MGLNPLKTAQDQMLEKSIVSTENADNSITETILEEGLRMLYETENIEMRSDVNKPMILAMSRGAIYVERFKSKVMANFMNEILVRSVSKDRKGRTEVVALVRNSQEPYDDGVDLSAFAKVMNKG